jgi:hypothetical protein
MKEIKKIRTKNNELETKNKTIQKSNERKCWFFKKVKKMYKTLVNLTKWRRKKTQINKSIYDKGAITTNTKKNPEEY